MPRRKKNLVRKPSPLPEFINDHGHVSAREETFLKWWPTFHNWTRVYFTHQNQPITENKFGKFQVVGFWGFFVQHYNSGHGHMTIGLIQNQIEHPTRDADEARRMHEAWQPSEAVAPWHEWPITLE